MVGETRDPEEAPAAVETPVEIEADAGDEVKHEAESEAKGEERAPVPDWLNRAFIQEALRRGGNADALVEDIDISYAIAPGDNYCSLIFRVKVHLHGSDKPEILIVKSLPAGEHWAKMVQENHLFDKEMITFSRVLPAMEAIMSDVAPSRFPPFAARCLHCGEESGPFIVLEDLRPQGFLMGDRRKGMDLAHAQVTLRALGRFHGVSSALWRRSPELFQGLLNPYDEPATEKEMENFVKSFEDLGNTISKWTDLPGDYGNKICGMRYVLNEKLRVINRERPGKFNVLIHGDFWLNNMLFRYEENAVNDVRFLDFQASHVGNLAIDLILLKYTSLQEEVFDNNWDALLDTYYESLTETLRVLGEEVVSFQDVKNDLKEAQSFSFLAAFFWLPLVRRDVGAYDIEKAAEDGNWSGDSYDTPAFRYWMKKLLPEFDRRGLFDELLEH